MSGVYNLRAFTGRPRMFPIYVKTDPLKRPQQRLRKLFFVPIHLRPAYDSQLESVYTELSNVTNRVKNCTRVNLTF